MIQLFQESTPFTNKRVDSPVSQNTFLNPVIMPFALNTTLGSNVLETVFYIKNNSVENYFEDIVVALMKEDTNLSTALSGGVIDKTKSTFSMNSFADIPVSMAFQYADGKIPNALAGQYQHNYVPIVESTLVTENYFCSSVQGDYKLSAIETTGFNVKAGDRLVGANLFDDTVVLSVTGTRYKYELDEVIRQFELTDPVTSKYDLDSSGLITQDEVSEVEDNQIVITLSKPAKSTLVSGKLSLYSSTDEDIKVKFSYGYDQISDYDWNNLNSILVIPTLGNSTTPNTSYIPIRMRVEWITPPSIYTIRKYFLDVSYSTVGNVV